MMLTADEQTLAQMESQHPGIRRSIAALEATELPACHTCGSLDTARVMTGVIGRTIYIAGATTKAKLVPNGPTPAYYCNRCDTFFDSSVEQPASGPREDPRTTARGHTGSTSGADLISAYRATYFRVTGAPAPFTLQIGQRSPELDALHRARGVGCSAFLTAWNPGSVQCSAEVNEAAQRRMVAELEALGVYLVAGVGEDPTGQWPGEASLLAVGLSRAEASAVGRAYGQAAVVWIGPDAVPQLLIVSDAVEPE